MYLYTRGLWFSIHLCTLYSTFLFSLSQVVRPLVSTYCRPKYHTSRRPMVFTTCSVCVCVCVCVCKGKGEGRGGGGGQKPDVLYMYMYCIMYHHWHKAPITGSGPTLPCLASVLSECLVSAQSVAAHGLIEQLGQLTTAPLPHTCTWHSWHTATHCPILAALP